MNIFDDITEDNSETLDGDIFAYQPTVPYQSKAVPTVSIDHPDFIYYEAAATDVTRTWRRFGWTPIQRDAA
jgi:hypothetical protein